MTKRSNRPDSPGILSTTCLNHGLRNCRTIGFLGVFLSTKNNVRINQESPWTFWKGKQVALETPFFFYFNKGFLPKHRCKHRLCRNVKADTTHCLKLWGIWIWVKYVYACKSAVLVALPRNPCYSWQTFVDAREHLHVHAIRRCCSYSNQKLRTLDSQNFITYYRAVGMK